MLAARRSVVAAGNSSQSGTGWGAGGTGTNVNLSALPAINTGSPQFLTTAQLSAIDIANVVVGPSGTFTDPISSVPITRITNASTFGNLSLSNTGVAIPYVEGGPWASREWGGTKHTICAMARLPSFTNYLVDYDRDTKALTNGRALSVGEDQRFSFANDPATPRIAYVVTGAGVLRRYDTEAMAYADTGYFPKTFTGLGTNLLWLHADATDRYFCLLDSANERVIWWDSQSDTVKSRIFTGLDEPHMEKNGRYIAAITGTNAICWDTTTDTISNVGTTAQFYHAGHLKGGWISNYSDASAPWSDNYFTPKGVGVAFDPQAALSGAAASTYNHWGSWVQSATVDQQYAGCFSYNHGISGGGTSPNHGSTINCLNTGTLAHNSMVYRRADGGDNRYLCTLFNEWIDFDAYYGIMGGFSPDGKLCVFSTNMLSNSGRTDLFAANVPLGA